MWEKKRGRRTLFNHSVSFSDVCTDHLFELIVPIYLNGCFLIAIFQLFCSLEKHLCSITSTGTDSRVIYIALTYKRALQKQIMLNLLGRGWVTYFKTFILKEGMHHSSVQSLYFSRITNPQVSYMLFFFFLLWYFSVTCTFLKIQAPSLHLSMSLTVVLLFQNAPWKQKQ